MVNASVLPAPVASSLRCARAHCEERPIIDLSYAGEHLCRRHFIQFTEERVRRELHRQASGIKGGTLAVAVSGGKDSATMLSLLARFLGARRNIHLVAITIDEGIAGYRSATLRSAEQLTSSLGIEHHVRRFEQDLGTTTDVTARTLSQIAPCTFCGVWRRTLLNRAARDLGATHLAVGFNLDDLAQTVLMNLARGEPARLLQMAPHRRTNDGLVPRIAPLAPIPEREVYLYARLREIPFDHSECPHAGRAVRNVYRTALWQIEEAVPGTRHALLKTREKLLEALEAAYPPEALPPCINCGEPSSGGLCRSCALRKQAAVP